MEPWRPTLNEALELFRQERWEEALNKFLSVRDQLAPPSVDVQIFFCLKELNRFAEMTPYLETTVSVPGNDRNAELWRILGLLYLSEGDCDKAITAWKRALDLNPLLAQMYQGLNVIHVYDSMKAIGSPPIVEFVDFATGNFSVRFSTPANDA
jgi:tetratricopeptide (TPR) repeat protein